MGSTNCKPINSFGIRSTGLPTAETNAASVSVEQEAEE